MTNPTLPQAVAALRPDYSAARISRALSDVNHDSCTALAFECHKALSEIRVCQFGKAGLDRQFSYEYYKGLHDFYRGEGDTHEEAIFAAVLDWWSKRGNG